MKKALKYALAAAVVAGTFTIGILIGVYGVDHSAQQSQGTREDITEALMNEIKAENINSNLKILTGVPHLAGTAQDLEQANWVRDQFLAGGLDEARVIPYRVLLSYPDFDQPNKVYLTDDAGTIRFNTSGRQTPLKDPAENHPSVVPNFNAYSASGVVEGELVYAFYGRDVDYDVLTRNNVNVTGRIVIARYGKIFRGNIAKNAEERGALGVILYSDPQDFAPESQNFTYPDSWWMPGMAVQSGTIFLDSGDPLTPRYPSLDSAYRIPESQAEIPKIPVQPIGYVEAVHFLNALSGSAAAPNEWRGALNATYNLGPSKSGWKIKMDIKTSNKMATIHNTIGFLYGEEEPDRYVLIGNHRDAWILGSVDPSSGTASMLELARAFGTFRKERNWRPKRTLVFCSWGAEEYGLIGSYEWVEEHAKVLSQRAVAYLNLDVAVGGNYSLEASAVPMLHRSVIQATKEVPNPLPSEVNAGRVTVFDTWVNNRPNPQNSSTPNIGGMGSGSDFAAFIHRIGVPCVDMTYGHDGDFSYPLYHTLYDSHVLSSMIDPGFFIHQAITRVVGRIATQLAESQLLPFDVVTYADHLKKALAELKSRYQSRLEANNATFSHFEKAVDKFVETARNYTDTVLSQNYQDSYQLRKINDQLMQLERAFVDPLGLPDQPSYSHIVFAPSSGNSYATASFAGLTDLLEAVGDQSETQQPEKWVKIKQHLALIAFYIDAAATSLKDGL